MSQNVWLAVLDSGPGVSSEAGADLFEPFVSGKRNGLGLGLTISRSIGRGNDGSLRFDPSARCGARIVLSLPSTTA